MGRRVGASVISLGILFVLPSAVRSQEATDGQAPPVKAQRSGPTRYKLQQGDRLVKLAKQFDVDVDAILEANKLTHARDLQIGQELLIPPPGTKARAPVPRGPQTYRLHKGDHLVNVAKRFGVSVEEILRANDLDGPRGIQAGQELLIPLPGQAEKVRQAVEKSGPARGEGATKGASSGEPRWVRKARRLAEDLGLGGRQVALRILRGDVDPRWVRAAGKGRPPATLRFPVAGGTIGRGWGSGTGGYHLAVDIPGKTGTRVSAAAPGIVAYAGDELAGFGKLVIIVHPGGLVTSYAHNSEIKTVPGERVKQGTRIALLGSTGISRGPHVHFELLHEGELCDPGPLLRPPAATKGGRPLFGKRELAVWPRRGGPPKGLQCAKRRRHPEYVGKPYGWRPDDWATRYRKQAGGGEREAASEAAAGDDEPHPDPELTEPGPPDVGEE